MPGPWVRRGVATAAALGGMMPDGNRLTDAELTATAAYYAEEGTTWFDPDVALLVAELRQYRNGELHPTHPTP